MFDWLIYLIRSVLTPPVGDDGLPTTDVQSSEIEIPDPEPNAGAVIISGG